jgi:hypothetical protein
MADEKDYVKLSGAEVSAVLGRFVKASIDHEGEAKVTGILAGDAFSVSVNSRGEGEFSAENGATASFNVAKDTKVQSYLGGKIGFFTLRCTVLPDDARTVLCEGGVEVFSTEKGIGAEAVVSTQINLNRMIDDAFSKNSGYSGIAVRAIKNRRRQIDDIVDSATR